VERRLTEDELAFLAASDRGLDGRSTDIASGDGTPSWILGMLRFCSRCGAPLATALLPEENRERLVCAACGFISYVNPRLVVTTIPVTDTGEAILLRRGIEPGRGWWAQPGGFLEVDETVHQAAVRETLEETGLHVAPGDLVGLYSRLEAGVVVIAYEARITGGEARTTPEALEVRAFAPAAIPWAEIAFKTSFYAIRDWVQRRDASVAVPASFREGASG
jgi:ADP-ribose pyrophosphatase YjhB (NUDIX family)